MIFGDIFGGSHKSLIFWVFDVEKRTILNAFRQFWIFLRVNLKIANICFGWSVRPNVLGIQTRCWWRDYV